MSALLHWGSKLVYYRLEEAYQRPREEYLRLMEGRIFEAREEYRRLREEYGGYGNKK